MKNTILIVSLLALFYTSTAATKSEDEQPRGVQWGGTIEAGYFDSFNQFRTSGGSVNLVNGLHMGRHAFVGIGVGLNYYGFYDCLTLPLSIRLKTHFTSNRLRPFFQVDGGYNFVLSKPKQSTETPLANYKDADPKGIIITPAIGLAYRLHNKHTINLSFGYSIQSGKVNYKDDSGEERTKTGLPNMTFVLGFSF